MKKSLFVWIAAALAANTLCFGQVPGLLNYQGRLLNGTNLFSGVATLSLRLYDASAAGHLLYEDSNSVPVVDGLYTTLLGDQTNSGNFAAALTNDQVWLEIAVAGTPLTPRERLVSSAYALMANGVSRSAITADMLAAGSVTAAALATGAVTTAALASNSVTAAQLAPGSVGLSQLAKAYQSGSVAFPDLSFVSQTNFTVTFASAFAAPPSVTLGLASTSSYMATGTRLTVTSVTTTNFTGTCVLPLTTQVIRDTLAGYNGVLENVGGLLTIAYSDPNGSIRVSQALDESGTAWSTPALVDTNAWGNLAFGMVNGAPAVVYVARATATGSVWNVRYKRASSTTASYWPSVQTLDTFTNTGLPQVACTLAVAATNPAVAYIWAPTGATTNNLRFTRASDATGGTWSTSISLDWVGSIESYASLKIINSNPAVAYYDSALNDLCFVRASNTTGSAWTARKTVASTGLVGQYASLETVNGQPAIGYIDQTTGYKLFYVRATDANGTTWGSPVGVDTNAFGSAGVDCSLRVIGGKPAMSYQYLTSEDLRFVQATDANGASWGRPVTVDALGSAGQYTSLIEYNGRAAIAHYDRTRGMQLFVLDQQDAFTVNWIAVE